MAQTPPPKRPPKRIRIGEFEYTAATPPPRRGPGGPRAPRLAADALQALNDLGVDSVLVLADGSASFANTQNKHAEADGIKGVKFIARNPHKVGDHKRHDIYAIRVEP